MKNSLSVIDGELEHEVMYFAGNLEVSEPLLVTPPFVTKKGIEVVAIADRGGKKFIFTKEMLNGVQLTKTTKAPDWLSVL